MSAPSLVDISTTQIALISLLFVAGTALAALFRLLSTSTEAVRKELLAEMDKRDQINSKARHDIANRYQIELNKLEQNLTTLQREAVRREDLTAVETRLTQALARLDTKMDSVGDKLVGLAGLEKHVQALDARLENALRRYEAISAAGIVKVTNAD